MDYKKKYLKYKNKYLINMNGGAVDTDTIIKIDENAQVNFDFMLKIKNEEQLIHDITSINLTVPKVDQIKFKVYTLYKKSNNRIYDEFINELNIMNTTMKTNNIKGQTLKDTLKQKFNIHLKNNPNDVTLLIAYMNQELFDIKKQWYYIALDKQTYYLGNTIYYSNNIIEFINDTLYSFFYKFDKTHSIHLFGDLMGQTI